MTVRPAGRNGPRARSGVALRSAIRRCRLWALVGSAAVLFVPAVAHGQPLLTSVAVEAGRVHVSWSLPADEDSDVVELSSTAQTAPDGSFPSPLASAGLNRADRDWLSDVLPAGTYYVHVGSLDGEGNEQWSAVRSVTIGSGGPGQPAPIPPAPPASGGTPQGAPPWSWQVQVAGQQSSIGLWAVPEKPTLGSLASTFGAPDDCVPSPGQLHVVWRLIGLSAFASVASSPVPVRDCQALPGAPLIRIVLTAQPWTITPPGLHLPPDLRIGDEGWLVPFFYPQARAQHHHESRDYFLTPKAKPSLTIQTAGGSITAFLIGF